MNSTSSLENSIQREKNQLEILNKMRKIQKEIQAKERERSNIEEQQKSIKDIVKVDNIELGKMFRLNEAYLVELENEKNELSYQLYTEKGLIGISNEQGLIELDPMYIKEKNEELEPYGPQYLMEENQALDPQLLEEESKDTVRMNELEEKFGKDEQESENEQEEKEGRLINDDEEQQEEPEDETDLSKMEDDIGSDITSCYKIKDPDFSKDVLGYQTGHEEKYLAYSKSRNTFILIGESKGKFEEIQDICGAQGGPASSKQCIEYDENGNAVETETPSFVMMKRDRGEEALAIDMKYGEITLSKLTPSKEEPGKYDSEEINVGHSIRPSLDEIEAAKEREEQIKKEIAEKEQEIEDLKANTGNDENEGDRGKRIEKAENDLKEMKENDDDDYDWSTGRPMPRH